MRIQPKLKPYRFIKHPRAKFEFFLNFLLPMCRLCLGETVSGTPADKRIQQTPCNPWNAERRHGWQRVCVCVYVWAGETMISLRHHPPRHTHCFHSQLNLDRKEQLTIRLFASFLRMTANSINTTGAVMETEFKISNFQGSLVHKNLSEDTENAVSVV